MSDISNQEIHAHVKRLKKQKATGPDEIPIEIFKEMDDENLQLITDALYICPENTQLGI